MKLQYTSYLKIYVYMEMETSHEKWKTTNVQPRTNRVNH